MAGFATTRIFRRRLEAPAAPPGSPPPSAALRPGGTLVQVGLGGAETPVPMNLVVSKEITLRGTFRFHAEFEMAVSLLARGAIDVAPLLTEIVPLAEACAPSTGQ